MVLSALKDSISSFEPPINRPCPPVWPVRPLYRKVSCRVLFFFNFPLFHYQDGSLSLKAATQHTLPDLSDLHVPGRGRERWNSKVHLIFLCIFIPTNQKKPCLKNGLILKLICSEFIIHKVNIIFL